MKEGESLILDLCENRLTRRYNLSRKSSVGLSNVYFELEVKEGKEESVCKSLSKWHGMVRVGRIGNGVRLSSFYFNTFRRVFRLFFPTSPTTPTQSLQDEILCTVLPDQNPNFWSLDLN